MSTWDDLRKDVPARFILPLEAYIFQISFVEVNPLDQQIALLNNNMTAAVVEAVRNIARVDLAALKVYGPEEKRLFRMTFGHPGYSFSLELFKDRFIMGKLNFSLEDLSLTIPIFEALADQFFGTASRHSLVETDFYKRTYRISHIFRQEFTLGARMSEDSQFPKNLDVMPFFVSMADPQSSALQLMQPEEILRADGKVSFLKTVGSKRRNIWITFEGPWNVTQRDIVFQFELRTSEGDTGVSLEEGDFRDFDTPMFAFYRDFILTRLYPHVFKDISLLPKI